MSSSSTWGKLRHAVDRLIVFGNQEPILTIRRVLWFFTGGLWLGVLYAFASLIMASTIFFAPFALQVLIRLVPVALDGFITLEPVVQQLSMYPLSGFWNNPAHPYTMAANIAWAVLIGWALVLAHLATALVQALTVINIGTALTNIEMAKYVIWPFGREIHRRELPTTLADLYLSRLPPTPSESRTEAWV